MKNQFTRRDFICNSSKAGAAVILSATVLPNLTSCDTIKAASTGSSSTPYAQQPLPYSFKALEPAIDAQTMELHYTKHAAGYAKNLADAASEEGVNTTTTSLEALLGNISRYSTKMRNNAGGHYNHELFWKCMAPHHQETPGYTLINALVKDFGSYDSFKTQFSDAAKNRFGSGWAWLVLTNDKSLKITSTANQDNPLMNVGGMKGFPILSIDVWEHAYYLKYQNRRPEYITNWWNVVNWQFVTERYNSALKA